MRRGEEEAEIDRLPIDLLAHILSLINCFKDLAQASGVCQKWKQAVKQSLARRERLSFAGWKMDDESTSRLVLYAYNLKELDIPRSRWGCQITDIGLYQISSAKCVSNLTSISLWGMTGITDKGVVQLTDRLIQNQNFHLHTSSCIATLLTMSNICCICYWIYISFQQISRTTSLQHLNIGGTFITDDSLFAIADSCPNLKTIVLWSCRHVTGSGLLILVNKCQKLKSIDVWGTRVPLDCFIGLLAISPALQIKPKELQLNIERVLMVPV
ncbi:hypothetical protein RHMOL_Rhmol10G0148500 [Rhododendron molle]|uniref:Uncharacterized protein n=1 Tax=Rhododendron molle TaxID=49168 RepID=A0ACC0M2W2_RHOML|nr:hypothetical protein RHMOL_Rhmol10G0148500 [Rhododendron molle]